MDTKRKHALPMSPKKTENGDHSIRGEVTGTYRTQAISDDTDRQPETGVAIPSDACIRESKDWVDSNEK